LTQPYKRPESVLVVVFTRGGEILMMRRAEPSGFWQSVTGSLEPRERPVQAALREILEETGLARSAGVLIDLDQVVRFPILPTWRSRYAPGVHYNREHWFAFGLPDRRPIRLNRTEHRHYRWLPLGRAVCLATSWTNRHAILSLAGLIAAGRAGPSGLGTGPSP
jgi:dATP pyrophosphohydrolase